MKWNDVFNSRLKRKTLAVNMHEGMGMNVLLRSKISGSQSNHMAETILQSRNYSRMIYRFVGTVGFAFIGETS